MANMIDTVYGRFAPTSDSRLQLTYDYEHGTLLSFFAASKRLGVQYMLDIGANIGCYSIMMGKLPDIKAIFSFEPAPEAFGELKRNIALQTNKEIFVPYEVAASDEEKQAFFRIESPMSGVNRLSDYSKDTSGISVQCMRVDDLVHLRNSIIAIKVDVEGHEIQALAGMSNLLQHNQCIIQVEALDTSCADRLEALMKAHSYTKIFVLRDDYIFVSASLTMKKEGLQEDYFHCLQLELRELLHLRSYKRDMVNRSLQLVHGAGYPYDPIALG